MQNRLLFSAVAAVAVALTTCATAFAEEPGYAGAMRKVVAKGKGKSGVVLHIGDSITYAAPYGAWARYGEGKSDADVAVLGWMHTNANNDTDGWHLARTDHKSGGRSMTACSGIRADELRAGGKRGLPSFTKLLDDYKPQIIVLMIGTNDASASREKKAYLADVTAMLDSALDKGVVPILTTIPPHPGKRDLAASYNDGLRAIAKEKSIPLVDYEKEILARRKDDWNGTLLAKDDVHPTAGIDKVTPASAPSEANLSKSGYLLRCFLTVRKLGEVKATLFDKPENKK